MTVHPQPQAYMRLANRPYLFENLGGRDCTAQLPVDEDGIVLYYAGLFRRVMPGVMPQSYSRRAVE